MQLQIVIMLETVFSTSVLVGEDGPLLEILHEYFSKLTVFNLSTYLDRNRRCLKSAKSLLGRPVVCVSYSVDLVSQPFFLMTCLPNQILCRGICYLSVIIIAYGF